MVKIFLLNRVLIFLNFKKFKFVKKRKRDLLELPLFHRHVVNFFNLYDFLYKFLLIKKNYI
jgi:hypothetical protein